MSNGFSSIHPLLCFIYFISTCIACMIFTHPFYLYTILVIVVLLNWSLDGGKALNKVIRGYLVLAVVICVLNPIFSSKGATILFYIQDHAVTVESMVFGVQWAITLLSILLVFVAYNLVMTPDRFLYVFASFAPKSAFVVTVTLRFVPLLKRRLSEIMTVQKIQGSYLKRSSKRQKMRDGMETLYTLITWSLEEGLQTANSMRARGYGVRKRTSATIYELTRNDYIVMWIMAVTGVVSISGLFLGLGQYEVYPQLQKLEWTPLMMLHFLSVFIFVSIPIFLNGKVLLQWHIIRSRM